MIVGTATTREIRSEHGLRLDPRFYIAITRRVDRQITQTERRIKLARERLKRLKAEREGLLAIEAARGVERRG